MIQVTRNSQEYEQYNEEYYQEIMNVSAQNGVQELIDHVQKNGMLVKVQGVVLKFDFVTSTNPLS